MFFDEEKPIQKFVSTMMDEALASEKQREKALLEQGNRLLVAQTVLITALVTEIPLLNEKFTSLGLGYLSQFAFLIVAVLLVSVAINIFSQWRFNYITYPQASDFLNYEKSHKEDFEVDNGYYESKKLVESIYTSLIENNDKRSSYIKAAMMLTIISIGTILLFNLVFFC